MQMDLCEPLHPLTRGNRPRKMHEYLPPARCARQSSPKPKRRRVIGKQPPPEVWKEKSFPMQITQGQCLIRRGTTVSQKGCCALMMLTAEWWKEFLLPVGRRKLVIEEWRVIGVDVWWWKKEWRLLCKEWRELWDHGLRSFESSRKREVVAVAERRELSFEELFFEESWKGWKSEVLRQRWERFLEC